MIVLKKVPMSSAILGTWQLGRLCCLTFELRRRPEGAVASSEWLDVHGIFSDNTPDSEMTLVERCDLSESPTIVSNRSFAKVMFPICHE